MGANCVKEGSVYTCDFEKLLTSDRDVLEFLLRDQNGNEIKDPEELHHMLRLIKGDEPGGMMIAGANRGGMLVDAVRVNGPYELVHKIESIEGKSRVVVRDTNAEFKFAKSIDISLAQLGFNERMDSAVRSVARALDIPYHPNVLQPEVIEWDGTSLRFISAKAEANLKDIASLALSQPNRGSLLTFMALQLIHGLEHTHRAGIVLGDVSSANILLFKQHGIPELKLVPGKHSVPAADEPTELGRLVEGLAVVGKVDLDVVPCAYVAPGSRLVASQKADIWAAGSSLFEALTGVPYGCACSLPDYSVQLARLEVLGPDIEPATFMKWYRHGMDVPAVKAVAEDPFVGMGVYGTAFLDLVRKMVLVNPDTRPTAEELLKHPLFSLKPHPRAAFKDFHEMMTFVQKFHKASPEARWALLKAAADEVAGVTAVRELPHALKYLREHLVKGLMQEFDLKYPKMQRQLSKTLYEAVRLTDMMLRADTPYNEYARLMLANWDFVLDSGTPFEPVQRQKLLSDTLDYCAKQFQVDLSREDIEKTKASALLRYKAKMFVEQKEAREGGFSGADALAQIVSQALSSRVWADENKALVGRRAYVSSGRYSTQSGVVERVVGQGEQSKLFLLLDTGDKVVIDRANAWLA